MLLIIKKKEIGILTNDLTTQIEGDFIALLDDHFSLPETFDSDLDAQIAKWYSNPPMYFPREITRTFHQAVSGLARVSYLLKRSTATRFEIMGATSRGEVVGAN